MDKKTISQEEFAKRVETEAEFLVYMDRMSKDEAFKKANQSVSQTYSAVSVNINDTKTSPSP